MKDTFSTYHPLLNMLYFVGVIGVTVFVVHPVILAISLFGGIAYSVLLKGWKKTVKFNLIFSIPMMLIVALMNPMFNHYGVTIIGYLHNGNPFTLESCVYGLVMAMMLVCTMIWFSCYTIVMTSDKFIYLFGKVGQAFRLAAGSDFAHKFIGLGQTVGAAFADFAPGLAPFDWLVGIVGAVAFRLLIYFKSKNAKKYRKGMEYGSARWSA